MKYRSVATAFLLVSCAGLAAAGDVNGKISFSGTAPKPSKIMMNADPVCVKQHKTPVVGEEVVVNKNGTLKNVLVYVKEGLGSKKFDQSWSSTRRGASTRRMSSAYRSGRSWKS